MRKHGVSFHDAVRVFDDDLYPEDDVPGSLAEHGEVRVRTIGVFEGHVLLVISTETEKGTRIISARPATRYDVRRYEQARRKGPWPD